MPAPILDCARAVEDKAYSFTDVPAVNAFAGTVTVKVSVPLPMFPPAEKPFITFQFCTSVKSASAIPNKDAWRH
ncbi:unannotated protein [freshwater metagenome]|uniref:Unannotated protein n=1 Tax=freshwater metagenome TaxID=449393 RepID=A0A6J6L9I9_9ZZZZ